VVVEVHVQVRQQKLLAVAVETVLYFFIIKGYNNNY
jgi:hypothetical protein